MIALWVASALAGTARLGLFVGNNVGFGTDETLTHAEREARDVALGALEELFGRF